jgi:hypothetical protein
MLMTLTELSQSRQPLLVLPVTELDDCDTSLLGSPTFFWEYLDDDESVLNIIKGGS